MKKLKGRITIGRPNCGDGSEYISIQIKDEASRSRFLDIEVGYSEFAQLLTGMSEIECNMITRGLENVGKKIIKSDLSFIMPETNYKLKGSVADKLAIEKAPSGWTPSLYWGSKSSFIIDKDGTEWAHTSMSKLVDED